MTTTQATPGQPPEDTHDPRLYIQIAAGLRAKIRAGTLTTGTTLHTAHLAAQCKASRETVTKALRVLEKDGLLTHYPHYGYCVLTAATDPGHPNHPSR